jgi:hypothetical protein
LLTTMLPAVQAANSAKDLAALPSTWAFMRALGNVLGIAVTVAIFNN